MFNNYNENSPRLLAKTHVNLHKIDPIPLVRKFSRAGIDETEYHGLDWREDYIHSRNRSWLKPALQWINDNYPSDEVRDGIIHGDLHPLNVIVKGGKVSGVVDWSSFKIEDTSLDVATLYIVCSIVGPVLIPNFDWGRLIDRFLDYYEEKMPLCDRLFEYFRAYRSFIMLVDGERYDNAMRTPKILEGLLNTFRNITGIQLISP